MSDSFVDRNKRKLVMLEIIEIIGALGEIIFDWKLYLSSAFGLILGIIITRFWIFEKPFNVIAGTSILGLLIGITLNIRSSKK